MPVWIMGPSYLVFMGWLFMGIAISADIFMEAIEVITSQTSMVSMIDQDTQTVQQMEVVVWNPTLANLTLMAFGSSAPEIILSILEALKDLGKPAGDLGPSTIVGSAAFNLLVISGVSIAAVGEEVKKIDDMGVFITTSVFSVFAYVWLYYCLSISSPGEVTTTEAYLTFSYFIILLILAFSADKMNQKKKKRMEEADAERSK
jgi:solute carrier family 8 (sodium/calcium exchanger)